MNEIIKSAIDRIKLKGEEIWVRYSFWTKAKDVELESGENVENKLTSVDATLSNHVSDKSNPHETTKEQVGLSYVDNTSDVEKPVSTHQREAIDASYQQSTSYTDTKIAELINGAPTTLDTLKEIADAMTNNQTVVEALEASIGSKADQAELDGHINNSTIHITADERAKWNNQSDCSEIIGTTNISNISDGTLTGAVSALNSDLANKVTSGSTEYVKNGSAGTNALSLSWSDSRVKATVDKTDFPLATTTDLSNYLPLSGGTMTGSIAGNNGGYFATDGNVYSPLWGGWLSGKLNQFLDVTGSDMIINPVSDVNNFGTGIALFHNVSNLPPGDDWFLIISGGGNGTNVQVAYPLANYVGCYRRICADGAWSNWVRTDDPCRTEYWNGVGALFPFGNVAVFRSYDDSGYAPIQASAFTQMSSKYAKDNIEDMTEEQASKILQLRSVNFDYKNGNKNQSGFIAEEVLKILPCCVSVPDNYVEDPNASEINLPRLDYSKFVPFLVKEIQILNDRITKLEENK